MKVTINGAATSVAGGRFSIHNDAGETIASVTAIETIAKRGTGSSYDRHRRAKGDDTISSVDYVVDGDIEAACVAIAANLPESFRAAKFGARFFKTCEEDYFSHFDFLRTLQEQGGWYGNTPKSVVRRIKATWKTGFALSV